MTHEFIQIASIDKSIGRSVGGGRSAVVAGGRRWSVGGGRSVGVVGRRWSVGGGRSAVVGRSVTITSLQITDLTQSALKLELMFIIVIVSIHFLAV